MTRDRTPITRPARAEAPAARSRRRRRAARSVKFMIEQNNHTYIIENLMFDTLTCVTLT